MSCMQQLRSPLMKPREFEFVPCSCMLDSEVDILQHHLPDCFGASPQHERDKDP